MSDVDDVGAVADLLDADPEEFDDSEAFREFVDEQFAEIREDGDERDDRLDDHDTRVDALSTWVESVEDRAHRAEQRAERAERMARWGGLGYDERLWQVVETLVRRAEGGRMGDRGATITTGETEHTDEQGNRYTRTGVYQLYDGAVSRRTCRSYIHDLGELPPFAVSEPQRGGWGGGSEQLKLHLNLSAFQDRYGVDWDIDDLLADMGGDDA